MKIDKIDIAILRVLDGIRGSFEYAWSKKIIEKLPYRAEVVKKRLLKLNRLKMIEIKNFEKEIGCKILQKGLDTLAIWNFKKHGIVREVLTKIGEGKESVIYSAISPSNEYLVLKFHRYYAAEFEKIKKSLAYSAIKLRGEELRIEDYKIDIPKAKAQVEFHVMKKLWEKDFKVPKPIDLDRHVVAMEMIYDFPGIPSKLLKDVILEDPQGMKEEIVNEYLNIVEKGRIIHGDFSEFNVMVKQDGNFFIIDWPQAVPTSYEFAEKLKERDLNNILNFFKKKYDV